VEPAADNPEENWHDNLWKHLEKSLSDVVPWLVGTYGLIIQTTSQWVGDSKILLWFVLHQKSIPGIVAFFLALVVPLEWY
jgi:hypothetical protein